MSEIGDTSHMGEEFLDIPVDVEHPSEVEPIMDPEEGHEEEPEEQFYDDTSSDGTSSAERFVGRLADEKQELEDRVQHLEEENQTHQYMEEQYKTVAHQLTGENADLIEKQHEDEERIVELEDKVDELEEKVQEYQNSVEHIGLLTHELLDQDAELKSKLEAAELKAQQLEAEKKEVEQNWENEIEAYNAMERERDAAHQQVRELEDEIRHKKVRFDRATYAYRASFGRIQSRVHFYPREDVQTRRTISRERVMEVLDEEFDDAVRQGMHTI